MPGYRALRPFTPSLVHRPGKAIGRDGQRSGRRCCRPPASAARSLSSRRPSALSAHSIADGSVSRLTRLSSPAHPHPAPSGGRTDVTPAAGRREGGPEAEVGSGAAMRPRGNVKLRSEAGPLTVSTLSLLFAPVSAIRESRRLTMTTFAD